jgi:hypothetical protein
MRNKKFNYLSTVTFKQYLAYLGRYSGNLQTEGRGSIPGRGKRLFSRL